MVQDIIQELFRRRGMEDEQQIREFCAARPQLAHDPYLLTNMEQGVDMLLRAMDEGKRIVVYGDYDADGVTSTVVLLKTLGTLTKNLTYYIPSRIEEGYGLHRESIDRIQEQGGEFIVTVDCGSASPEELRYAKSLGIEVLVTDHHNMSRYPEGEVIINPKAPGDTYPFKGMAGVGVAYKLALAIAKKRTIPRKILSDVLEFVAIGTIADIMPLLDENRSFVKYGLMRINSGCRNPGLRRLIELSGYDCRTMKASGIAFGVAPRINAAGRIGDASLGVKLFMSEEPDQMEKYCTQLIECNRVRKKYQDEAYAQCIHKAEQESRKGDFLLIEAEDVHEGIIGIVAGKIKEELHRPTVIVLPNGENYKGSGRSVTRVDIYEMLSRYRDQFIQFGGHRAACGFTIAKDRIGALREHLNQDIQERLREDPELFDEEITCDMEIEPEDMTLELAQALDVFEPCGKDNETPRFRITGVVPEGWRYLKQDMKYAKFEIGDLDCILFHDAKKYADMIRDAGVVNVYGTLDVNTWRNISRPQMVITDMEPYDPAGV